jgi:carbon-monoxide dehydrogenase medium subunit
MLAMRLVRFEHLVDLNRIAALQGIRRDNGGISIGAMTRQADVGADPEVRASAPLLAEATRYIGHFQIRNRGTIGGSIAHADPAAEYPAVALALGAELEVASRAGRRTIPAAQFFEGTWTTALSADELLVSVRVPVWGPRAGFAVEEVAGRAGDFAVAGVACGVQLGPGGAVERAAIGLIGLGRTPERAAAAEAALTGATPDAPYLAEIGRVAVADVDPPADVHASSAYRRKVGGWLVQRALARAFERAATGGGDA